ncbi:MAG: flagellar basal-body rod protein FlgG [Deltaproteobacteria bacterium]|nr:flagellar basal-body rod protein FlgG [Deltaproteobacteria bacterium]
MMRALYTAATGMNAQETRMNVSANNLANSSTTGFKKVRTEFEDLLSERIQSADAPDGQGGTRASPLEVGLGVRTGATTRSFSQGDMINTGNPLDLTIQGKGFFKVQRPDGLLGYTRAGNLTMDANGRLVTQNGMLLDPAINVPQDAQNLVVRADGTVTAQIAGQSDAVELGNIEIALFQNAGGLHSLGGNLFESTPASGLPIIGRAGEQGAGTLAQGFLEGSNVSTVEEMIGLITTQRAYELNSKVISTADQMLQKLSQLS